MPQCKKSNCREPALPTGKRYCVKHMAEYLQKQRLYKQREEEAPLCPVCSTNKLLSLREQEDSVCSDCRVEREKQAEKQRVMQERFDERMRKIDALAEATTVEELKQWMRDFMPFLR